MQMLAPTIRGQKNSHTDTSKLKGVFCNTRSSGDRRKVSCIHNNRLASPRCTLGTPLGLPVEPDV